jgi:hypothetical protein
LVQKIGQVNPTWVTRFRELFAEELFAMLVDEPVQMALVLKEPAKRAKADK